MKIKFSGGLLLVCAVFALVCAGCPQNKVTVPAVGGFTLAAAQAAIEGAGLDVGIITYAESETVAVGAVISQNPAAGAKVDEATAVSLVISTGPAIIGGKVIGWVRDAAGSPLPEVLVALDQPTKTGIGSTTTNVDGLYSFDDVPPQNGLVLRFSRNGYTPNSQYVDIMEEVTTSANSVLLPLAQAVVMDAADGGTVEDETTGAKLTIPPNAFVTEKGAVTGDVTVQMTPLDITEADQLTAFPGNYRAVEIGAKDGEVVTLETFGLVDIRVTQDLGKATETEVQLAEGVTARIEIPLQPDVPAKQYEDLRLWWFNDETGVWEEESNLEGGVEASSGGSGMSFYAEISHFSWWNCDAPLSDKACVSGRVVDEQLNPIAGAEVEARGVSYDGSTYGTTNDNGEFCLNVKGASDVEIRVTLPAGSTAIVTQAVTAGAAGDSCDETGVCTDLGDIEAALTSCIHGVMRNANDEPMAGLTVYSSAGTTAVTDDNGEFCLEAPAAAAVTVWCFGGTSVQVITPEDAECPTGCAEVELRTVRVYDGAEVGFAVSTQGYYKSDDQDPFVFAQFATSGSDESMVSLGYFGYFGFSFSYGQLLESLVGSVDSYAVYDTFEEYFSALLGCDFSEDAYEELYECLMGSFGQITALDPGAPGLAEFDSGQSADMLRLWDLFDSLGYFKKSDEVDYWARLKALSYGQFISANYIEEPEPATPKTAPGPVDISWPGGTNIAAFTATLPGVPSTPVFTYPAFGEEVKPNTEWWFDGSEVSLTWVPEDASSSLLIAFQCSGYYQVEGAFFSILVWAKDDGQFTLPASAFVNMPPNATQQTISAVRLAFGTKSVPFTEQAGHGILLLESQSDHVGSTSVSDTFTLSWNMSVKKNNCPTKAAPANDNLAYAQPISGASGSVDGTVKDATAEAFELAMDSYWGASVWYTWTAPEDGYYEFDLNNWDLYVAAYDGDPSSDTLVGGGSGSVYEWFDVGETYNIVVFKYYDGYVKAQPDPRAALFPRRFK